MKDIKTDISRYIISFALYSVMGWIYEVVLETFVYGWGFSNRGVLTGPYCPIYGVGALIFIICVYPIIKNKEIKKRLLYIPAVFIICMAIATAVELAGSYVLEYFTGSWPWQTYKDYAINYQGRIALSTSVRFGIGGVIVLYVIQPFVERAVSKVKNNVVCNIAAAVVLVFAVDIVFTLVSAAA